MFAHFFGQKQPKNIPYTQLRRRNLFESDLDHGINSKTQCASKEIKQADLGPTSKGGVARLIRARAMPLSAVLSSIFKRPKFNEWRETRRLIRPGGVRRALTSYDEIVLTGYRERFKLVQIFETACAVFRMTTMNGILPESRLRRVVVQMGRSADENESHVNYQPTRMFDFTNQKIADNHEYQMTRARVEPATSAAPETANRILIVVADRPSSPYPVLIEAGHMTVETEGMEMQRRARVTHVATVELQPVESKSDRERERNLEPNEWLIPMFIPSSPNRRLRCQSEKDSKLERLRIMESIIQEVVRAILLTGCDNGEQELD
ncbi:hypothetical protein B0H11DRAFT_1930837 [Mycena galericulata]|nr:hypothetical protein B0H11DRAFT_1930837 [Mycena galericulata]